MAVDWLNSSRAAPYRQTIIDVAQSRGISPNVLANQLGAESGFRPEVISGAVTSSTGAVGIAQILPSTARDPGYGVSPVNPRDPVASIGFAADYTIARGGYNARGLAAYSGGDYSAGTTNNILAGNNQYAGPSTNGVTSSSDGTTAAAGGRDNFGTAVNAGDAQRPGDFTTNPDGSVNLPEISVDSNTSPNGLMGGGSGSNNTPPVGAANNGSQLPGTQTGNAAGGTTSAPGSGSGGSGFGAYLNEVARAIANQLSPSTEKAGQTVASATEKSGQSIAKGSTDAATISANQSKANATLFADTAKDYFGRAVIIILGIVFVGGGVAMFVFNRDPVKLVAKAIK